MNIDNPESFYCIVCNRMYRQDKAYLLFRTGFFRVMYPLGCCLSCRAAIQFDEGRFKPIAKDQS
ncbi:hypothetical protein D3H35_09775 [Cohnella faecalis]|uniref:Uncharacterized protein n=1 Tax=Cohnella faecalis TaxID=2315694 RepID=A0A398CNE0_9BACL|nr:hypothetical protein D3H35_09775 [Cohnella faecalis]